MPDVITALAWLAVVGASIGAIACILLVLAFLVNMEIPK